MSEDCVEFPGKREVLMRRSPSRTYCTTEAKSSESLRRFRMVWASCSGRVRRYSSSSPLSLDSAWSVSIMSLNSFPSSSRASTFCFSAAVLLKVASWISKMQASGLARQAEPWSQSQCMVLRKSMGVNYSWAVGRHTRYKEKISRKARQSNGMGWDVNQLNVD